MKKFILGLVVAIVLAFPVSTNAQTPATDVKLSEVQKLQLDNLRLTRIAIQQQGQLLQAQFAELQKNMETSTQQLTALTQQIITEQKLQGYTFDVEKFTFVKPTPKAPEATKTVEPKK